MPLEVQFFLQIIMALKAKHKEVEFKVGDRILVTQKITEGGKFRASTFEGIVIAFKNAGENRSFTVRRMGAGNIGIEKIFPLATPSIEKIDVIRKAGSGVRRAKLYYIRKISKSKIDRIYSRSIRRDKPTVDVKKKASKAKVKRPTSKV